MSKENNNIKLFGEDDDDIKLFDDSNESKFIRFQILLFFISLVLGYIISAIFYNEDVAMNVFLAYIGLNIAYTNYIIKKNNSPISRRQIHRYKK